MVQEPYTQFEVRRRYIEWGEGRKRETKEPFSHVEQLHMCVYSVSVCSNRPASSSSAGRWQQQTVTDLAIFFGLFVHLFRVSGGDIRKGERERKRENN